MSAEPIPSRRAWWRVASNAAAASGLLFAVFLFTSTSASARDAGPNPGRWWDGFNAPGVQWRGNSATVRSMTVYRGDLILAGDFRSAGSLQTRGLARWDGRRLSRVGDGPGGDVRRLIVYGDALVAAGNFAATPQVPAHDLALWDRRRWIPIQLPGGTLRGSITSMTVDGGVLVVAGQLPASDGTFVTQVAIWDGHDWRTLGSGFTSERAPLGDGPSLTEVTMFGGDVIAAGRFDHAGGVAAANIARWDGQSWQPLGPGVAGRVENLALHAGSLIVNGRFREVGDIPAQCVAAWDGTRWSSLGTGLPMSFGFGDVFSTGREILVSGWFDQGDLMNLGIARWNGSAWRFDRLENQDASANIFALALYDGSLVAGGYFEVAHGRYVSGIARVNGTVWEPLLGGSGFSVYSGDDPGPTAMTTWDGDLIVANEHWSFAGDQHIPAIARWDGTAWHPLGGGIEGDVAELTTFQGDLVAAGEFASAGGVPANNIARWNGTNWTPIGAGFSPYAKVRALTVYRNQLVAGGSFSASGGQPVFSVARWDGNAWKPFGDGLYWDVLDLAVFHDELIAAGAFTSNGHSSLRYIARWDGSMWRPLGQSPNGVVSRLAVHDGVLVAAGSFTLAGGNPAIHVATWDGFTWRPLADGIDESITDLTIHDGLPTVSWWFGGIATWDGISWQRLGTATSGSVKRLCSSNGSLFAVGDFLGFEGVLSSRIARWDANVVLDPAVRASEPAVPIRVDQRTRLAQSSETRRGVQFVYTLGGGAGAEISIYDVRGRLLQALPLEGVPGPHALAWDRQDRTGRRVARGIYFARLTSGTEHDVRKLVLLAD